MEDKYKKTYICIECGAESKPMPKNMGDLIWKCECGLCLKHSFRKDRIEKAEVPERNCASGSKFV